MLRRNLKSLKVKLVMLVGKLMASKLEGKGASGNKLSNVLKNWALKT